MVNSSSSVEAGKAVADSLPTESLYVQADISDQSQGHDLIAAHASIDSDALDILVNNAGWTTRIPHTDLDALTDEIFRKTFEVNVFGTWWLTKAAMPHLRESPDGNVVTITSIAGVASDWLVDRLRDVEGHAQPHDRIACQGLRTGARQRRRARPCCDPVDLRSGKTSMQQSPRRPRCIARRRRRTAPKP